MPPGPKTPVPIRLLDKDEVMILRESSPQLVTKLLGTEEYEKENSQSERD